MNKKRILSIALAIVGLSNPATLFAQSETDYIVLSTGDSLVGKVQHIKEDGNRGFYDKIRIINIDGKRRKYAKTKVTRFRVNGSLYERFELSQQSEFPARISLVNPKYTIDRNGELHFLRVVSKGKLSHYQLEWFEQGNSTLWSFSLLKKEDDNFFIRADQGLLGLKKKTLHNYFSDCQVLQEAVKQKQVTEVSQVVQLYAESCLN